MYFSFRENKLFQLQQIRLIRLFWIKSSELSYNVRSKVSIQSLLFTVSHFRNSEKYFAQIISCWKWCRWLFEIWLILGSFIRYFGFQKARISLIWQFHNSSLKFPKTVTLSYVLEYYPRFFPISCKLFCIWTICGF